jgi:hypothetical protein
VEITGDPENPTHTRKAGPLWHYLRRRLTSEELADDLLQEAWIAAAEDEGSYLEPEVLFGLKVKQVLAEYLRQEFGRLDGSRVGRYRLWLSNEDRICENTVSEYTRGMVDTKEIRPLRPTNKSLGQALGVILQEKRRKV